MAQRTKAYHTSLDIQRGVLIGFSDKKATFTTYIFNAGWTDPTVVLSLGFNFYLPFLTRGSRLPPKESFAVVLPRTHAQDETSAETQAMIEVPAVHIPQPGASVLEIGDTQGEGAVECDVESASQCHGKPSRLPVLGVKVMIFLFFLPGGTFGEHLLFELGIDRSSVIFCTPTRKCTWGLQRPAVWTIHWGPTGRSENRHSSYGQRVPQCAATYFHRPLPEVCGSESANPSPPRQVSPPI